MPAQQHREGGRALGGLGPLLHGEAALQPPTRAPFPAATIWAAGRRAR
jgi:hypothetical protein